MATDNSNDAPSTFRHPTFSYAPNIWHDFFTSYSSDDEVQQKYAEAIEPLKKKARSMLMATAGTTRAEKLVLIDTLERLGVAYHFEQEIENQLQQIFKFHSEDEDYDLFTTALQFRLLRQHCHHVSCRVFDKFKSEPDNKFEETLSDDAKGLLSLYEAAHLRMHGEDILDEAVVFTTHHLNRMVQQLESPLQDQVKRALVQPIFKGVSRVETRYFISFYEKDGSKNDQLLKLAKLDFNYVQNIYKKELYELNRWSREVDIESRFPYARDRVVELYLWAVAFCYKPQYSYVRFICTKFLQLTAIIDDTYDNYATLEEAELFTDLLQRWDINEIDQLPDYMKAVYRLILSMCDDFERDATARGKSYAVPCAIESLKQLVIAYIKEFRWSVGGQLPTFEEFLANTLITTCCHVYHATMFVGVESASKETFDWLMSTPKVLVAASNVCRLQNDLVGYEREKKSGKVSSVDVYMKQYCLSLQETLAKFVELVEQGWKDISAEWTSNTCIPKELVEQIINYDRGSEMSQRECKDGFTNPEEFRSYITFLFMDPIII